MTFEPVPWAIGAGAELGADVLRSFTNIATQDTEGINLPGDFKVSALNTPGPQVTIAGGGITIRNTQQPGQSYVGVALSDTVVNIAANASGSTRRDMIVARIIDPDFSPWQPYVDPNDILYGPYFEPHVESGVPANATTLADAGITYAAYPLARIDIPNGTTNITSGMIVDLRRLARPRTGLETVHDVQAGPSPDEYLATSVTSFATWPSNSLAVPVPYWATDAEVSITFQVSVQDSSVTELRVNLGGSTGSAAILDYNGVDVGQGAETRQITAWAVLDVTAVAGTTVTLSSDARRTFAGTATGAVGIGTGEQIVYDIRFVEAAV